MNPLVFSRRLVLGHALVTILTAECGGTGGGGSTPTAPTTSVNLTGTFAGNATDSSGSGRFTWQLTQFGSTVSGPISFTAPERGITGNGSITGTLFGTTLTFSITIPEGGAFPFSTCSVTSDGTATDVSNDRIPATYTGTNSCSGPFTDGTVTLTRP